MSENADINSRVRPSPPAMAESDSVRAAGSHYHASAALLRLLVGGVLTGIDELQVRLRRWDEAEDAAYPPTESAQSTPQSQTTPQRESESLRYAVTGFLFETETRTRRRFTALLDRIDRASDEAEDLYMTTLAPALLQTPLAPALMRLEDMLVNAANAVNRWSARGRIEEQQSRRMAQRALASAVDEVLQYMARNPEVRALIEQQGLSLADEAVNEAREHTATADMWVERVAHNLLRRPVSEEAEAPARKASTRKAPTRNMNTPSTDTTGG